MPATGRSTPRHFAAFLMMSGLFALTAIGGTASPYPALAQAAAETGEAGETTASTGVLGDDFARTSGAIIVTAKRGGSNLFEDVPIPENSCLANAPALGSREPGFAIDASGLRKVRDLEKIRRKTRAGTIFIRGGSFVGQSFRKGRLYDVCFFGTDLSQTDWTGVSGSGLGFINVDLTGAKMARTKLPHVLMRDATLTFVDAREADWRQGQLDGGWSGSVRDLNLTGANLTGFRVVCGNSAETGCPTDREGMSLTGANLRRASFHDFFWPEMDLSGARIDQTELALDHLRSLQGALLAGPIVLRSPRRAIMLFPGEAKLLADAARPQGAAADVCTAPSEPALALVCQVPGSATGTLLRSVAQLEATQSGNRGFASRRIAWAASRDACMRFAGEEQQLTCVLTAYTSREAELRSAAGNPDWVSDAGYRLFLSSEAAYPTNAGQPGLYGRILPILLDSAVAAVIVKTDGKGYATARGVAVGGCSFETGTLAYSAEEGTLHHAIKRRGRRGPRLKEALLGFSGPSAQVKNAGLVAMDSCSSGDTYPRLTEIELDDALLATIWDRF
ncbi:pentapeptide repeat-containing protein [Qipengyuania sp. DGS5-3]|uniref:pentapeptide repeat-containing protein n=1 Tax=Qipengyuania sp. DGS5-3 TaxID=3349632 RepID=UPI0036D3D72A